MKECGKCNYWFARNKIDGEGMAGLCLLIYDRWSKEHYDIETCFDVAMKFDCATACDKFEPMKPFK